MVGTVRPKDCDLVAAHSGVRTAQSFPDLLYGGVSGSELGGFLTFIAWPADLSSTSSHHLGSGGLLDPLAHLAYRLSTCARVVWLWGPLCRSEACLSVKIWFKSLPLSFLHRKGCLPQRRQPYSVRGHIAEQFSYRAVGEPLRECARGSWWLGGQASLSGAVALPCGFLGREG